MVLPQGEQWNVRGTLFFTCFQIIYIYFVFYIYRLKTDSKNFQNADVGPQRPANLRPFERRHPVAPVPAPQDAAAEVLAELEHDL